MHSDVRKRSHYFFFLAGAFLAGAFFAAAFAFAMVITSLRCTWRDKNKFPTLSAIVTYREKLSITFSVFC